MNKTTDRLGLCKQRIKIASIEIEFVEWLHCRVHRQAYYEACLEALMGADVHRVQCCRNRAQATVRSFRQKLKQLNTFPAFHLLSLLFMLHAT